MECQHPFKEAVTAEASEAGAEASDGGHRALEIMAESGTPGADAFIQAVEDREQHEKVQAAGGVSDEATAKGSTFPK